MLAVERRQRPTMQAAARFRAMKAFGAVVAPTDTVLAQFWRGNDAVVAQFSRPRHNCAALSRRLKHQPRVLAHGVEADLLPVSTSIGHQTPSFSNIVNQCVLPMNGGQACLYRIDKLMPFRIESFSTRPLSVVPDHRDGC